MCRSLLIRISLLSLLLSVPALAQPTCTLNVNRTSGTAPLGVTASGLCSSPLNNITQVVLNWGDGTLNFVNLGFTATHTYAATGTFNVVVTAYDSNGQSGSATATVKALPPLQCAPSVTPSGGQAPLSVQVSANCTDPSPISSVLIQLGDGYYQSGQSATHTYVSGGNFNVVITAKDSAGNAFVGTVPVKVTAMPVLDVSISNGQVKEFGEDGTAIATLGTRQGGSTTGMGFDTFGDLYVTDFTSNAVSKFTGGSLAGQFGAGYNCKPESIVFDQGGNAYVGETGCSHALLKLDPYGTIVAVYQPAVEQQGTDWIDLASDQCTIYYTSQGASVLRFNVCTRQQLAPLTSDLTEGLGLRILPDGGVLVADLKNIKRFDGGGKLLQTYDAPGEDCWSAVALDSDGTSFWATDYCTSNAVRFDLATGGQVSQFNAGVPPNSVFGIQSFVPPHTTPAGALVASPQNTSITPGQAAAYSLTFNPVSAAVGQNFSFTCANLPVGASCTFSPPTVTAAAGAISISMAISTSNAQTATLGRGPVQWLALFLPVLPLLCLAGGYRKRLWLGLALVVLAACMLVSCGGGSASSTSAPASVNTAPPVASSGATPSGTYTVLVHAQAGAQESSTTVQMAVQ